MAVLTFTSDSAAQYRVYIGLRRGPRLVVIAGVGDLLTLH